MIGEEIDAETKDRWGRLSYLKAASESLANLQRFRVILRVEDPEQLTFSAYNLAIANCPRVGGGFPIAPEADPTDGLADVVIVRPAPMAKLVTLLPAVLRGDEPESALFQSWKVREGEVLTDPVLPYSLGRRADPGIPVPLPGHPGSARGPWSPVACRVIADRKGAPWAPRIRPPGVFRTVRSCTNGVAMSDDSRRHPGAISQATTRHTHSNQGAGGG